MGVLITSGEAEPLTLHRHRTVPELGVQDGGGGPVGPQDASGASLPLESVLLYSLCSLCSPCLCVAVHSCPVSVWGTGERTSSSATRVSACLASQPSCFSHTFCFPF